MDRPAAGIWLNMPLDGTTLPERSDALKISVLGFGSLVSSAYLFLEVYNVKPRTKELGG